MLPARQAQVLSVARSGEKQVTENACLGPVLAQRGAAGAEMNGERRSLPFGKPEVPGETFAEAVGCGALELGPAGQWSPSRR